MGKESACQCRRHRRHGSSPGLGRYPGEGNGIPLEYSCLENPCTEEPGGPHCKELDMIERLSTLVSVSLKWPCRGPCTLAAIEVNILEVLHFLESLQIT